MEIEEIKAIDCKDVEYAVNTIIFFGIENDLEEEDGILHEHKHDFIRSQEDVVDCMVYTLNHLGVDYSEETKIAEEQLVKIVNTFIEQWGNKYSLDECYDENKFENIFYLMVMSAYHHGVGLWEEINDLGKYPGTEESIYCPFLVDKILEKYNEKENKSRG